MAWVCSGVHIEGYEMKAEGAIPKGMYPVKGVTVEDNEISGYGNGVSISLADTDTVTGNQIKMKKTSSIFQSGYLCEGCQRNGDHRKHGFGNCQCGNLY